MSVKIRVVDNNFVSEEMAELSLFGSSERIRIESISNDKRRSESASGLVALKSLVCDDTIREIARDENGRPHFVFRMGEDFNLSHSGTLTAVAYLKGEGGRVGIDIELIKEGRDEKLLRIAERYFSEKEKEMLEKSSSTQKFYRIWTEKEAEAKMTGAGLSKLLADRSPPKSSGGYFSHYLVTYLEGKYVMTLCTNRKEDIEFSCDDGIKISNFQF